MASAMIDVDALEATLRKATQASLPWVSLNSSNYTLDEPSPPPITVHATPWVMAAPDFVPDVAYKWRYRDTRQVVIDYIIQRTTSWVSGRIKIFHDMPISYLESLDEPVPPPIPYPFTPHNLYFSNTVDLEVGTGIGMTLCALHDPSQDGNERFGLGFQITSASPSSFPLIGASYISVIPLI